MIVIVVQRTSKKVVKIIRRKLGDKYELEINRLSGDCLEINHSWTILMNLDKIIVFGLLLTGPTCKFGVDRFGSDQ